MIPAQMSGEKHSSGSVYGDLFADGELAIARALVTSFCKGKGLTHDDFDDLLQTVLVHWAQVRERHDPARRASKSTYMRGVVRNKLRDLRDSRLASKHALLTNARSLESPVKEGSKLTVHDTLRDERPSSDPGMRIDLESACEDLTCRQREIIECKLQGTTNTGIARQLGVHRDTVQDELKRVRDLFRDKGLEEYLRD